MTPEEINIAIAEHFGYEFREGSEQWGGHPDYEDAIGVYAPGGGFIGRYAPDWTCIPNYTGDLNAVHAAEETLPLHQLVVFAEILEGILVGARHDTASEEEVRASMVHATAAQRAKAFLRAVGKWREAA